MQKKVHARKNVHSTTIIYVTAFAAYLLKFNGHMVL